MAKGNLVVGQSGGPTCVINSSLYGVIKQALKENEIDIVYGTLNASRETSFRLAGLNLNDEKIKRETELAQGLDEVFTPRKTAYTTSGDDDDSVSPGRPQSNDDKGKQNFDKNYNKNK